MALENTEAYEIAEAGYLRIDLCDGMWVALMSNDGVNFGGTLWERSSVDGHDYSSGNTAGYPVLGKYDDTDTTAKMVARYILMEGGEEPKV